MKDIKRRRKYRKNKNKQIESLCNTAERKSKEAERDRSKTRPDDFSTYANIDLKFSLGNSVSGFHIVLGLGRCAFGLVSTEPRLWIVLK